MTATAEKPTGHADLPIEGMSCASCAMKVEKSLGAVEGVSEATVNFATGRAAVEFEPGTTSPERLADAVGPAVARAAPAHALALLARRVIG